jgi:hypothetical protein
LSKNNKINKHGNLITQLNKNNNIKTPRILQNENRLNRKHRNIIDVTNNKSEKKLDLQNDLKYETFRNNNESDKNLVSKSIFIDE